MKSLDPTMPAPGAEAGQVPPSLADEALRARLQQLEAELVRLRRSRNVLMDVLWRVDRDCKRRVAWLEHQNRRLWGRQREGTP